MNNTTKLTLTAPLTPSFTGSPAICSIVNRSPTASVFVDLKDATGPDTYELAGQGDKVDIDMLGASTMTIRATAYPCDILLNLTSQRAALASPALDVIGGINQVSPLSVIITNLPTLSPANSVIVCQCTTPPAGSALVAFDQFRDQSDSLIGTGAPTDALVIAHLAAMGLAVNAAGEVFNTVDAGVYAIAVAGASVAGPTAHVALLQIMSGSGFSDATIYETVLPAGSVTASPLACASLTDVLIVTNILEIQQVATALETDFASIVLNIVRVR
jgi:hypothetical protein